MIEWKDDNGMLWQASLSKCAPSVVYVERFTGGAYAIDAEGELALYRQLAKVTAELASETAEERPGMWSDEDLNRLSRRVACLEEWREGSAGFTPETVETLR